MRDLRGLIEDWRADGQLKIVEGADADRQLEGAMQRLRNLGVPESRVREVREKGVIPRTIDWPSPATGEVIVKRVINGQRVWSVYRVADAAFDKWQYGNARQIRKQISEWHNPLRGPARLRGTREIVQADGSVDP